MNSSISITFGKPRNGWLSVDFCYEDVRLSFDASDGINNPIEELYNAITKLQYTENETINVTWWLEPEAYFFDFVKKGRNTILTISESEDLQSVEPERKSILIVNKLTGEITEPFYIALRQLCSQKYQKSDWSYEMIGII